MRKFLKKPCIFIVAAVVVVSGFGFTLDQASAASGPTSINLKVASGTGTSAVVDINGKVKVYVSSVYPSTYSKAVTWSIYSGSSYAKIASYGGSYCYVQGIKTAPGLTYGTVTIKAKSKYYPYTTKYIKLYVKQLYPTGVTLSRTTLNLWTGTSSTLTATVVKPSWVYSSGVTWSVGNSGIATVGSTGKVNGVGPGSTRVYATSKDKSSLRPYCTTNVFSAALTKTGRFDMAVDDPDISNPAILYGPAVTKTITYSSSNNSAVTVSNAGVIHAVAPGSATITARVTIPSISAGANYRDLSYVVNVKNDDLGNDFQFNQTSKYLEITQNTTGFLKSSKLMLSPAQLNDLFGYGSIGMNIWDPMEMYFNFQATDFTWNAGDFSFAKDMQSNTALADVEVVADKNATLPTYHPFWLDDTNDDKNCVDLVTDGDGIVTGYAINFFYDNTLTGDHDSISLTGNELTLKFQGSEMKLVRNQLNQVQAYATVDTDGTLNDLVLTITRNITGYKVVVNDPDYLSNWGVKFNEYPTYL